VIQLSWRGKRTISTMVLQPANGISAAPLSVRITSPAGTRQASIGLGGVARFAPLITDRMDISFPSVQSAAATNPMSGQITQLPVGLSQLYVPALADLRVVTPSPAARFSLSCGQGPRLTIDGTAYRTAVSGSIGALTRFLPVQVRLCTRDRMLRLGAGRHWLTTAVQGPFAITDISLTGGAQPRPDTIAAPTARAANVFTWTPEWRQLGIGPGTMSYLEIHENFNPGWTATLNGRRLTPVRLDGWQQAFVAPAGGSGIVTLTFAPAKLYHIALALSVLVVIALLVVAARRNRSGRYAQPLCAEPTVPRANPAATFGSRLTRARTWLGLVAVGTLLFVVGGPVVLAVPVLAVVSSRWPRSVPALAAGAMLAAGWIAATAPQQNVIGSGAFSAPAQAFALIALAAALTPTVGFPRDGESSD
jgi:arabinofuranan 3-O-arabinosyltransferase